MKLRLAFYLAVCCLSLTLSAQEVLRVEEQELQPLALLRLLPVPVDYSVQSYLVVYTTTDPFGRPDTASGLLSVPADLPVDQENRFPLAVYNHGTANGDRAATVSTPGVQERILPTVMAARGYVVCSPDYLGFGVDEGRHPYVHAATEASAGRDMILAVRAWLTSEGNTFGAPTATDQLYLTGYSQGGHATAALHRDIALNPREDDLEVSAATYLSGPYSISDVMRQTVFQDDNPTLPGYIAYTYISYNYVYGLFDSLAQAFVPPYLDPVRRFASREIALNVFNAELDSLLQANNAQFNAIFQDSIREVLREGDPAHPLIQALADNDTYDWAPEDPTLIYYCTEDEQVPFENAILADSVMRANGSTSVTLENGGPLDHGACVIPAMIRTLDFFDEVRDMLSDLGPPRLRPEVSLFPNPVAAGGALRLSGLSSAAYEYILYDATGRVVMAGTTAGSDQIRLPGRLRGGLHLLRLGLPDGSSVVRRLIVR